jgi:hypothetical protein
MRSEQNEYIGKYFLFSTCDNICFGHFGHFLERNVGWVHWGSIWTMCVTHVHEVDQLSI